MRFSPLAFPALAVLGLALMHRATRPVEPARLDRPKPRAGSGPKSRTGPAGDIRPAGPESMEAPPANWDGVDEASDESFPASDPPGNY